MDVLSVIVPIRNDERGIRAACLEIAHAARPLMWDGTIDDYEIVLVDDHSTDGTAKSADLFASRDRNVRVVHHKEERGLESAIRTGIARAKGDLIAHGQPGVPLATGALRAAIEKLRTEHLHAVAVQPDAKLVRRFIPGRTTAALKVVQRDRSAKGEEDLPRRATKLRLERPAGAGVPRRVRIGASAAAAALVCLGLIGFSIASGGSGPSTHTETLVGRHGHVPLVRQQTTTTGPTLSVAPTAITAAVVNPAVPKVSIRQPARSALARIDHTCGSDVTLALQSRIDSAPKDSTIALEPNGCYRLGGELTIANKKGITIDGKGAELRSGAIGCLTSQAVTLKNLRIQGKSASSGVNVRDCASVAISDVDVAAEGYGILLSGTSRDVSIHNAVISTTRDAIHVTAARRVAIDGARLKSAQSGVKLDAAAGNVIDDLEIRASSLTSVDEPIDATGDGQISDVYVHNNEFHAAGRQISVRGDRGHPSTGWRVYANRGDQVQSGGPYVTFRYVTNILVASNVLPAKVAPLRPAVSFTGAQGELEVVNNDFTGACRSYTADPGTGSVHSQGNKTSTC